MSADSLHHKVELAIKRSKKLDNFRDFDQAVQKVETPLVMQPTDFMDCPSKACKAERPLLAEIKAVIFSSGFTEMFWREKHGEALWKCCPFLRQKEERAIEVGQPIATRQNQPRGISSLKKADIIKKLTPLMSAEKGQFWHDLSSSFDTSDRNTNFE